jgi:hypothetical protein
MKRIYPILLLVALLPGCAQTVLYAPASGRRLASFQGDMTGSHYSGGGVTWDVQQVSHSTATLAQGQAAANVIGATGTAVAGAAVAIGASGWVPKLIGAAAPAAAQAIPAKAAATLGH